MYQEINNKHSFKTVKLEESDAGKRLDTFVVSLIPACSRSLVATLIREGKIRVHGSVKKPGYRLKSGDEISGYIPHPEPVQFEPEPIRLNILFEDSHLIVINKQAGLVVHPAPGHYTGTLVNGLLYHCPDLKGIGGKIRPGIVHRLDKDTSGTLIVAKNDFAHNHLTLQFKSRKIRKEYLAMVHGEVRADSGTISLPIGRHTVDRKKMSTVSKKTREAETLWKVKERFCNATLLHIHLKTGRTHQIRVHCAAVGYPIIGDMVYGSRKAEKRLIIRSQKSEVRSQKSEYRSQESGVSQQPTANNQQPTTNSQQPTRQMLHAWRIEFTHPATEKTMIFESPIPEDMEKLICALRAENQSSDYC